MNRSNADLARIRASLDEIENHHIDELCAGRLSRRDFIKRASVLGIGLPTAATIVAACGGTKSSSPQAATAQQGGTPKPGGMVRVATFVPGTAINPLVVSSAGGIVLLSQTGEFLVFDSSLPPEGLRPMLATGWTHNSDGTVWTFKLRKGVTFHTGQPMTADDVVFTFQQLSDPRIASNALSTFAGILTPDGVRAVDPHTVAFHLAKPYGNFPYTVSSDNYNAIIVPKGTDYDKWQHTFVGTGPFTLKSYTQGRDASFVRNPKWWGGRPYLDGTSVTFYSDQPPQILALQSNQVDVINQFVPFGAQAILTSPNYVTIKMKSSNHRELSMRNDVAPFTDPRVRRAVALTIDRPALVSGLLHGEGSVGNDSPFAPEFASTDTSVPQRKQNLGEAKQLLAAAGHPNGFSAPLVTEQFVEIPSLAQTVQADAAKAGIHFQLRIESEAAFYGKATYGNSDWLDSTTSIVDYGNRGAPNAVLNAALSSHGPWNASRFKNATYDRLFAQYSAAVDLQTQRSIAGKMQRLLLEETPIVVPYFIDGLCAHTPTIHNITPNATGQLLLSRAYVT